jgi:hypothetical protein
MEHSGCAQQVRFATPPIFADEGPGAASAVSQTTGRPGKGCTSSVFVFNPFVEGYIAHGKAFTPVKSQAGLAEDLASLPQFLCQPDDVVLLAKRPSAQFLHCLQKAGFLAPQFIELKEGRIDPAEDFVQRKPGSLRPWAWGPDSVKLLEPLLAQMVGSETRSANQCFNDGIARLYSKAWSAEFFRKLLARRRVGAADAEPWLCSEQEAGIAVDNVEDALGVIAAIRRRGHHRVIVKEAYGVAGHNALRLWEPELLPEQRRWLGHALENGRQLVVEPWLERELDFSVQLEMGPRNLKLCGYTGLVNDRKGQFLANWAEPDFSRCLPAKAAALFPAHAGISERIQRLYEAIFLLLEAELQRAGFVGPINIDAFVYRTPQGGCRLKPVVEINPRYTMGRLTLELMKHACPGTCGLFRLLTQAQARAEGFADLTSYAGSLGERFPLLLEGEPEPRMRQGAICLNDPGQAKVCLATFTVGSASNLPGLLNSIEPRGSH